MQGDQRGAKEKCSGSTDNLLIDRMVCQDAQRGKRNISMAWVAVKKAYDSVDHRWLVEMFKRHRFAEWFGVLIQKRAASWNTGIVITTEMGRERSNVIRFRSDLPQDDALCPTLFTLYLNPIAGRLRATDGYKLSRPISLKVTHFLYIDDLKIFAASAAKPDRASDEYDKTGNGMCWTELE